MAFLSASFVALLLFFIELVVGKSTGSIDQFSLATSPTSCFINDDCDSSHYCYGSPWPSSIRASGPEYPPYERALGSVYEKYSCIPRVEPGAVCKFSHGGKSYGKSYEGVPCTRGPLCYFASNETGKCVPMLSRNHRCGAGISGLCATGNECRDESGIFRRRRPNTGILGSR